MGPRPVELDQIRANFAQNLDQNGQESTEFRSKPTGAEPKWTNFDQIRPASTNLGHESAKFGRKSTKCPESILLGLASTKLGQNQSGIDTHNCLELTSIDNFWARYRPIWAQPVPKTGKSGAASADFSGRRNEDNPGTLVQQHCVAALRGSWPLSALLALSA